MLPMLEIKHNECQTHETFAGLFQGLTISLILITIYSTPPPPFLTPSSPPPSPSPPPPPSPPPLSHPTPTPPHPFYPNPTPPPLSSYQCTKGYIRVYERKYIFMCVYTYKCYMHRYTYAHESLGG